jgi:hypothetical protein
VPTDEGARWAEEEGLLFVEASAKSGANVEAAFEAAARDILSKIRRGVFDDDRVRACLYSFLLVSLIACSPRESSCPNPRVASCWVRIRAASRRVAFVFQLINNYGFE